MSHAKTENCHTKNQTSFALSKNGTRAPSIRLLDKHEVCAIANVSFPTVWTWMQQGRFPRGRVVGGKTMWLSTEIDAWLDSLPVRALKGDNAGEAA